MALCAFCNHSREFQLNIQALDPIFLRYTDRSKNSDKKHRIGLEEKLKQSTLDNISMELDTEYVQVEIFFGFNYRAPD